MTQATTLATVLIVDDDDSFRRTTARALTNHGYACLEANGSAEANIALKTEPDVLAVLCDIRMPGPSGIDLLQEITADYPDIAVLMTTGLDDPRVAELAFEIGAFGYIVKPFDTNELLINLASALRRRELEVARRRQVTALEQTIARTKTLNGVLVSFGDEAGRSSDDNEDTIERLSRAISLRDEETGRHMQRMSRYAAALAEAVGLADLSADDLRLAATLHDVGKIGVPDVVLLKPGALSPAEYSTMQRHAEIGYQLLAGSSSKLLDVAAGIALAHHEWWDGGGYPRGLVGTEIPEEARIAAVADVFDALTSDRIYRPAMSFDEAASVMLELRGRQFEPRLLDAFFELIDVMADVRRAYPDRDDADAHVRVLLVDDHEVFTDSLARLLGFQPTIKVVGTAGTVGGAIARAVAYQPDVVLMDFELPDGDGAEATARIKATLPGVRVVMLTARADDQALVRAIAAGCAGFVTKTESIDSLVAAIEAAHAGETVTSMSDLAPLLRKLRPTKRGVGLVLRPREIEVLALVAAGLPNKQIAELLNLSLNTIRNHVQSTLYKLQAHSTLEAVSIAIREGVLNYPTPAMGQ